MQKEISYTIEEVSQLLKVSKLTIYDLVKKGKLPAFRVGRQMRIDGTDLNDYIKQNKNYTEPMKNVHDKGRKERENTVRNIVIGGQDLVLDILGKHIEKNPSFKSLRSYSGSLDNLISMYKGEADIVSVHMFDGDTGEYNLPYIKKILVGFPYIVFNLVFRRAGLYVQKGNPLSIKSWADLKQGQIKMVNRERGSGSRILLDEQLRLHEISSKDIHGYYFEETNHLSVASAVSSGMADAGVGSEKAAIIAGIDFVPLISERYDIVILKKPETERLISIVKEILSSGQFQSEVYSLGDYDTSQTGKVIYETY